MWNQIFVGKYQTITSSFKIANSAYPWIDACVAYNCIYRIIIFHKLFTGLSNLSSYAGAFYGPVSCKLFVVAFWRNLIYKQLRFLIFVKKV